MGRRSSKFSLIHCNCRSMNKNFDGMLSLINSLDVQFSVIGVTETWLRDTEHLYNIMNYSFLAQGRDFKRGGGVGIYIRNDLDFVERSDLNVNIQEMESIFVEVHNFKKNVVIGVVYRPPNQSLDMFLENLDNILTLVTKKNKHLYLLGKFSTITC